MTNSTFRLTALSSTREVRWPRFPEPDVTDVALEPSDGPLPPPIKVVVPLETDRRVYRHETSTTSGTSSTLALIVGIAWLTL